MENKLQNPVWASLSETHKKWSIELNGGKISLSQKNMSVWHRLSMFLHFLFSLVI